MNFVVVPKKCLKAISFFPDNFFPLEEPLVENSFVVIMHSFAVYLDGVNNEKEMKH